MSATAYVIAAYGVFATLLVSYLGILLPRGRSRRRELAALEAQLDDHALGLRPDVGLQTSSALEAR